MCDCKNVEFGSYDNQVMLADLPTHMANYKAKQGGDPKSICVDTCIADEIKYLWSLGITTCGCCCGHNKDVGHISVIDKDIQRMKDLGYRKFFNNCRPDDEDSFIPKINTNIYVSNN